MNVIILGALGYYKNFIGQRFHFLANEFAKHHKVLFLETHNGGIKEATNGVKIDCFMSGDWLHNAYDVPLMQNKLDKILSEFIDKTQKSVVIFEIPLSGYINCISIFRKHGCKIIYDCIDNWRYFYGGNMIDTDRTKELIKQADSLTATAVNLISDLNYRFGATKITHIPNAYGELADDKLEISLNIDKAKTNIAYFGALGEWFASEFLYDTANTNHHICFHVFGNYSSRPEFTQKQFDKLFNLPNCHFYGTIKRSQIKDMLSKMDYGIIPFIDNPLIHCTDAVKAYEMIACGIKILYPDYMEEMKYLPKDFCIPYKSKKDIIDLYKNNYINKNDINKFLKDNIWENRYNKFMEVINAL